MQQNELRHYGVKGMKWGVRRYQKTGGSYTRAGVNRFNKSLDTYETGKALQKSIKETKKKTGSNSFAITAKDNNGRTANVKIHDAKSTLKSVKQKNKEAKRQLKKDYKHLRQDKLADQGKELYAKGYRITDNAGTKLLKAGASGTAITGYLYSRGLIDKNQATTLASISTEASAIGAGVSVYNHNKDRKLRAYYGHTSNY